MGFEFERIYKGTEGFPVGLFNQTAYLPQMHHHLEYELFFLAEGNAICQIEKESYYLKPNDVLFINPRLNHCITHPENGFNYYAMVFDSSILGNEQDNSRKLFDSILINQKLELSQNILNKIKNTTKTLMDNDFGKEILIKNLIYEILSFIISTHQFAPLPVSSEGTCVSKSINNGLDYIKNHYKENISFEDLLNYTNYSKSHFIRLFKATTGMNYTDYLNKFRVEKACRDLVYTDKNVTEIAMENGFNNIQYFSKIFKKYMECTPKQYQKRWNIAKI